MEVRIVLHQMIKPAAPSYPPNARRMKISKLKRATTMMVKIL